MKEKQVELSLGIRVSESMAKWIEITRWDSFIDNYQSINNAGKILAYLKFSSDEVYTLLKGFNENIFYVADVIITAFDAAESLGLFYDYSGTPQEKKDIFRAIAHCTNNGSIQNYLPEAIYPHEHVQKLLRDYPSLQKNTRNVVLDLDQIALNGGMFLPTCQIGQELKFGVGYTIHRN